MVGLGIQTEVNKISGYNAYWDGWLPSDNPYPRGSKQSKLYASQWAEARKEDKKIQTTKLEEMGLPSSNISLLPITQ